jgi:ABC-type proline/glycine betaine transport system permease subunit
MEIQQFFSNFLNEFIFNGILTENQSLLITGMVTFTFFWVMISLVMSIFERKRIR